MAFVLDVNLRIKEILGLQKVEAALSKLKGSVQTGVSGAGGAGGAVASIKAQTTAANVNAAAINSMTLANNKLSTSQIKSTSSTIKSASAMAGASQKASSFGQSVKIAATRYGAFLAATTIPFAALAGIGKATASVLEFDSAMLKVRQITGDTEPQMASLRTTILDLAAATGTSAAEIARVGKVLSQAGFRGEEFTESLSALAKVPLTPSFETMDAAIEGTIAALKQFKDEGLTTTKVLDVLTAVSNKFAASSEDIAKGISRGGAAFEAIGGTFQEFVGVFTTVRQATRESAETIGTFLKTISSRLADPKIVDFLSGKGIHIGEAIEAGNPVEAIKQIALALQDTVSIQDKIEIGTKLGGRRQISRLLALVANIETLDSVLKTAGGAAGQFGKIAEVGLEGLQAQLNVLGQEFNRLILTLAEPLFVPIIKGVTSAGKALVGFIDFIKPIIPALTVVIGFAAGFKILALSITAAAKAMAFLSSVGVGGGLPGILRSVTGGAAGGAAGASARAAEGLRGGVLGLSAGSAAVSGGAGARLGRGLTGAAVSPLGQLAGAAAVILLADKISDSFEKAGNSSGVLAAEFVKIAGILAVGASLLSGQSIAGAVKSFIGFAGPWGAAIAGAVAALGIFTAAASKAVAIDLQGIVDAAASKVSDLDIKTGDLGGLAELQAAAGEIGLTAIQAIQESADRFGEGLSGTTANALSRLSNFFAGEGSIAISDSEAQGIIETVIGDNPEQLNEIIRSAIEQFGVAGLETGLDKLLVESSKGNLEAASRVRVAMIKQAGGLEKIASSIEQSKLDIKVSKMAIAIEKVGRDFDTFIIPVKLSSELGLLSDAVGRAARNINTNAQVFSDLSQNVGRNIGVTQPTGGFSTEAVENIAAQGNLGDFIDLSQLPQLEGFTTSIARIGQSLEDFMRSIITSKASADSLRTLLNNPQIDPFDVLDEFIQKFIDESPDKLPPEAEQAFRVAAQKLGADLSATLAKQGGVIFDGKQIAEAFETVLGNKTPFFDASIAVIKTWLDSQLQQLNSAVGGEQLLAEVDVATSELGSTIVTSLQIALSKVGINLDLPLLDQGFGDANDVMIELAQNGDLVGEVLERFKTSYTRHAELNRQIAEAQDDGTTAGAGLLKASKDAAIEVINLQVALTQLSKIVSKAPAALAEQQAEFGNGGRSSEAVARETEEFNKATAAMSEFITRTRQWIEAQTAIDIGQVFEEPADIFARSLRESADAVKIFTRSLTREDVARGASVLSVRTAPSGNIFTERNTTPTQATDQQQMFDRFNLQAAVFGSSLSNVTETIRTVTADIALQAGRRQNNRLDFDAADESRSLVGRLEDVKFIPDILKIVSESNIDKDAVAQAVAQAIHDQSQAPGASEIEFIGALNRTVSDLTGSIRSLLDNPDLGRNPEPLSGDLTGRLQEFLNNLTQQQSVTPVIPVETPPFIDISTSAADIQQAAAESRLAADATTRSTEELTLASADIRQGGFDMVSASQGMSESVGQLQTVADITREAASSSQGSVGEGVNAEASREAIAKTTEAVNSLGERVDAIVTAVDIQTAQAADLAAIENEKPLQIEGLDENTTALETSTEATEKSQESLSELGDDMEKISSAMEDGIGIDIETMSSVTVDVANLSQAAQEFTQDFEEVALKVVKKELKIILQQLAAASGNPELSRTFESVI